MDQIKQIQNSYLNTNLDSAKAIEKIQKRQQSQSKKSDMIATKHYYEFTKNL